MSLSSLRAGCADALRSARVAVAVAATLGCAGASPSPETEHASGESAAVTAASGAPTETPDDAALLASLSEGPSDPLERVNRSFFRLNEGIDWAILDPISDTYRFLVPSPVRTAVRRAFDNLNSVSVLANDLLQCEAHDAIVTVFRFAINSTIGLAGFFDPATRLGLPEHESDFGETLYTYGVPSGPYLVLPLFGPSTARDAVGDGVDGFLRPQIWVLGPAEQLFYDATSGISTRESHLDQIRALRGSSLDYYSSLRGAYLMNREGELERRRRVSELGSRSIYQARSPAVSAPSSVAAPATPTAGGAAELPPTMQPAAAPAP